MCSLEASCFKTNTFVSLGSIVSGALEKWVLGDCNFFFLCFLADMGLRLCFRDPFFSLLSNNWVSQFTSKDTCMWGIKS